MIRNHSRVHSVAGSFLRTLAIATVSLSAALYAVPKSEKRPNIIIIYTDDQPWNSIGYYNKKGDAYTPTLDTLFENGMVCDNAYVSSTVCSPSRYSLLTGRYAGRCKASSFLKRYPADGPHRLENDVRLEKKPMMNIAGLLAKAGYATGFVGKSHITEIDYKPEQYPQSADPKTDPVTHAKMKRNHEKLCESIKAYGFTWVDSVYRANLKELRNEPSNVNNLEWTTDAARRFIEEKKDKPFFLYYATTAHHGPETFRGTGKGPYRHGLDADVGYTGEGYEKNVFPGLPTRAEIKAAALKHGASHKTANYTLVDMLVKGVLDKLAEHNLEENTLVIFASDHGTGFSSKTTLYDRGMHVPMVWYWKGRVTPGNYKHMISNLDVTPTVLKLCGVGLPGDYVMDGLDFTSALFGDRDQQIRNRLLGEIGYARAILTPKWKYIAIRYPKEVQAKIDRGDTFASYKGRPRIKRPYLVRNTNLGYTFSKGNPLYFTPDQLFNYADHREEKDNHAADDTDRLEEMKRLLAEELMKLKRPFGEFTEATPAAR